MRKLFSGVLFAAMFALAAGCQADGGEKYQAGKHYVVLPQPVRTSDPEKIEVTEVFWYGCPHCYQYSEKFKAWADGFAEDVQFVRNPAQLGRRLAELHTRAYYAAKALNKQEDMHGKLFSAFHNEKNYLQNEREISNVFVAAGVDRDEFTSVFNSFGVISQSMQAESRAKGYRVTGTPCLVVNGKYRITVESAGSNEGMMQIADFLIDKERQLKK